ncbi:MAG TPA: sigma-70 family RNA polymerase sigma factor, partial [Verrucomicrobiae bacterium]|nr:sigma-70 family RNA polymerase sigma factor [Verrucomicrobiae bacterium]
MSTMDDSALLQEYARTQSEPAFAALADRYVGLVYSAALRQMRDPHLAEDVTQAVFIVLARKAETLARHKALSGWLLKATRFAATTQIRAATRRAQREQEAYMQSNLSDGRDAPSLSGGEEAWTQLAPLLDEALASLGDTDRDVLALRYFENQTAEEIGRRLKLNEEAAQKRVSRALEKLRKFFAKRGVTLTASAIAGGVSANAVHAAPVGLATVVTATVAKGMTVSAALAALVKETVETMAWLKIKIAIGVGASMLLAAGVATVVVSHTRPRIQQTAWQKAFSAFPLLTPATNRDGQPAFQTLNLTNPVDFGGTNYFGFRFRVPNRTSRQDFVWSYVLPDYHGLQQWYILPQTGSMNGFTNYFYTERNLFPSVDALVPANGFRLILQSLSGD